MTNQKSQFLRLAKLTKRAWCTHSALLRWEGRINRPLLLVFLFLNGIVLFNADEHPSNIGYDSDEHLKYIAALADFRLPDPKDTEEFFSPPLPYLLPATGKVLFNLSTIDAGKVGQFVNFALSVGLSLLLIACCRLANPGSRLLPTLVLACLAMLPVYYKSFAFVRGEPFIAFFSVAAVWAWLRFQRDGRLSTLSAAVTFGILIGLLILSRQWGLSVAIAICLFALIYALKERWPSRRLLRGAVVIAAVSLAVGGWYYVHLLRKHGTLTAFNRVNLYKFSLRNQPLDFYTGTGMPELLTRPLRPAFTNQVLPVFYSETWGDYWCYFGVWVKRSGKYVKSGYTIEKLLTDGNLEQFETNYEAGAKYLGRVNALSLLPTVLLLAGWVIGLQALFRHLIQSASPDPERQLRALAALIILISLAGYFWFLIKYPKPDKGNTIKATYMLQIFPFAALLAGFLLHDLWERHPKLALAALVLLAVVAVHNIPAMITHFR